MRPFLLAGVGMLLSCAVSGAQQAVPADKPAFFTICAKEKEVVVANTVSFDFGEWPMWDNSLKSKAMEGFDERRLWQTGWPKVRMSHVFELQNASDKPLLLSSFDVEGEIEEIKSPDVGGLPVQIKPGKRFIWKFSSFTRTPILVSWREKWP